MYVLLYLLYYHTIILHALLTTYVCFTVCFQKAHTFASAAATKANDDTAAPKAAPSTSRRDVGCNPSVAASCVCCREPAAAAAAAGALGETEKADAPLRAVAATAPRSKGHGWIGRGLCDNILHYCCNFRLRTGTAVLRQLKLLMRAWVELVVEATININTAWCVECINSVLL